ncbi:MAG: hypothetical protein OES46_05910 [Gammaproteobacteria bacterium]|jgi:hypothetical protein|nr:hypothetical protein [Gammaproteobacteria bacterium]
MFARMKLPAFFLIAMIVPMALSAATEKAKSVNYSRITHGGKVVVGKSMDIGRDHKGIKLEAISFSGDEAIVIVWNKRPTGVSGHVGIALYDAKNRLIAAESDSMSMVRKVTKIRSGKQANFRVKFKKFLPNFKGVAQYRLVFTTTS